MANVVNRGGFPNDESADTLYEAFGKVNVKFSNVDLVLPTSDQKAALAGIGNTPNASNPFVTQADIISLDSSLWELDGANKVRPKDDKTIDHSHVFGLGAAALLEVGAGASEVAAGNHNHSGTYEPVIGAKGTAFNKNFGSNADTVCEGNDGRLSDSRTPLTHSHAIGDLPVATSGSSSTTQVVRADDSRLSDSRTPLAHNHNADHVNAGTLNIARIPTGTTSSTVSLGNHTHTNLPTTGEKAALAGTEGTPGASNKYITEEGTKEFEASDLPLDADQIRKITAGTADPTGGNNGDIYLQYEDD